MFKLFKKRKKIIYFLISFFGILILDQVSKIFVLNFFPDLITKDFNPISRYGLIWIFLFASLIILFYLYLKKTFFKNNKRYFLTGIIFGSALSNIIDRLIFNGVLDWISLVRLNFNFADLALLLSSAILLLTFWEEN